MLPKGIDKSSLKTVSLKKDGIQESIEGIESFSENEAAVFEKLAKRKSLSLSQLKKMFDERILENVLLHFKKDGII